ncbi:MAG: hypothetical protein MJ108_08860 [Saccharofermentans sp.]|nr:hypothetical protein [Saccharofermentans sp.]
MSVMVTTDEYFLQVSRYIHLNPVKAHMCKLPEHYQYSSYRSIINMNQDGISSSGKTLGFFKDKSVIRYRDFIEDIGHKYQVSEELIRKSMGEDELWLPW